MKPVLRNILIGAVLLTSAGQAYGYPPDNAAELYYKSFMLLEEPNDSMKKMLRDLKDGNTTMSEPVRTYLERNRKVIDEVVTAAEIKTCDWDLDFSKGLSLEVPHLAKCRQMGYILAADARLSAEKQDYRTAIERGLTILKMGGHMGNDIIIARLVGIAISGTAYSCMTDILPQISNDTESLQTLKVRLTDLSSRFPPMKAAMSKEAETFGEHINREEFHAALAAGEIASEEVPKEILEGDDEFFTKARTYWYSVMARIQIIFDSPYAQAMQEFEDLTQEVKKYADEKPGAKITLYLLPAAGRVYSIDTRIKTHTNAVLAGIEIYIIRAKTCKLPDELPAGLPKDLFSGKDFLYEKTDTGFVLKCQGKDLSYDTVRQYEFKIAN